ncbi:hypothetical protein AT302_14530 [Pandoraea norimbergensis]|uniref:Uncharacterized protein n=1 Tax=Pandoraea norimbergensis TaxID=93219 RepID=A0ABN4JII7_9BURK|nr:hypothetical protein AT302_14530 [Pandoraea norimbergensis]
MRYFLVFRDNILRFETSEINRYTLNEWFLFIPNVSVQCRISCQFFWLSGVFAGGILRDFFSEKDN